ncbi:MAG: GAF domain-containing protein [bacterium]|nr:GAF domain-containing protein [bacterium]
MRALAEIADAADAATRAAVLARGARDLLGDASVASVLLFADDAVETAIEPAGARGFVLRDGSAELRRLFLHALARFGEASAIFVPRERQRAFVGVSATVGERDLFVAPLLADGRTLGVIAAFVDGEPSHELGDELIAFAAAVSRVLAMDRALVAARRQSRDSQLLGMVNERLHKSLDRRDVLFGIVEGVRAAFEADRCVVFSRSPDGEHASIVAAATSSAEDVELARSLPLDADLRRVFGGLTVRRDVFDGSPIYGASARSAVALPFVVDGRVEDALVLAYDRPRAFADADVSALRSLSFHVGLALSNARLYERERARRAQAESLEHVVRILRDTQYVDEVLLVFVVTVSHELPVDCAAYVLDGDVLVRRAMRSSEPRGFEPAVSLERAALEPFLAVDEPSDASLLPRPSRDMLFDGRAGVIVPLRLEGALWGTFVVRWNEDALAWPQAERATFFRTLGSHLEIALANARAYERELRRAQERETLAEAARTILAFTEVGALAAVLSRLAATLARADRACVLRWSGERYVVVGAYGDRADSTIARSGFDLEHRAERLPGLVEDERRVQRLIDGPGYVVIPLAGPGDGDTIDAFLLVGRDTEERFGRDDLRIMQELGALLALALRNLDLYESTHLANRALKESNSFKDDLLAMLAHDFKGPLTVILGYCELLLESDPASAEEIETVYSQTKRLVRLSEDALVLAQTQAEGFSLARSVVDCCAFVADCVDAIARNNPRVLLDVPPERLAVELDPTRFRHVVDNLVSNALKYSQDDIRVIVRRHGDRVAIEVRDRGIGIPEGELSTLFTRFGRASNAREFGIAGSGIGLYVARKIVEVHDGRITVTSREGEGATFVVTLPLAVG